MRTLPGYLSDLRVVPLQEGHDELVEKVLKRLEENEKSRSGNGKRSKRKRLGN